MSGACLRLPRLLHWEPDLPRSRAGVRHSIPAIFAITTDLMVVRVKMVVGILVAGVLASLAHSRWDRRRA